MNHQHHLSFSRLSWPLLLMLALLAVVLPSRAQGALSSTDQLLTTLRHELDYNFGQLQRQAVKPYFMSYRVEDVVTRTISSSFGITNSDDETHVRTFVPQVRVGSMAFDNFKDNTSGGREMVCTLPYEDTATDGITTNIWSATQHAYENATQALENAKSKAVTTAADEDKAPCFSKAPAEKYYETPLANRAQIDTKAWEQRLNAITSVFREAPDLQSGVALLTVEDGRSYLVNTEGSEVVQNRRTARILLLTSALADDGMQLPLMQDYFAFDADSLPSQEVLVSAARDLLQRVKALKAAPVANPYTGPAILSGPAAGVFFHEIFGHRLEGHRLKEGGETFKDMVGKQVLPTSFRVFSDPTLRHYAGTDMNGSYLYDDEGVKARRVDNVVGGVLRSFLMSRKPIDGFPESNGHGRADKSSDPVSRQSNLIVETSKPYSDAQLRKMLIAEAKRQGKPYGYYFRTVTSGYTMTGEDGSINSFNVTPVEVYRVYVNGRPDELVRGVSLIGTPLSMFSHIQAGGDRPAVFTGDCGAESGWVPVTACAPSIYVSQIETQRVQKSNYVPTILPAPAFGKETADGLGESGKKVDDTIFSAMDSEMKRSSDSLTIQDSPKPFYVDMRATRARTFDITGELGGISLCEYEPWKTVLTTHLLLGDYQNTNEMPGSENVLSVNAGSQVDNGYLRRMYWQLSDVAYKQAVVLKAQKSNSLKQSPLPVAIAKLPGLLRQKPCTHLVDDTSGYDIDLARLGQTAKCLSAIYKDYPHLSQTSVKLSGTQMTSYRSTTEGVRLKQPHSYIIMTTDASFRDSDQVVMDDDLTLAYESTRELPSDDSLALCVRRFADDCMALRNAPAMPAYYKGPVLFTRGAAMRCLVDQRLLAEPSEEEDANDIGQRMDREIIDRRISLINRNDLTSYQGKPVYGHCDIDADGVAPAKNLTLIDHGVLKAMLGGSVPTPYTPASTGSAHFDNDNSKPDIVTQFNTLHIQADGTTPDKDMEKKLVSLAKKQKLDYAYIIDLSADQSALRLYQVDVRTGEKRLFKTDQDDMPTEDQLMHIAAISDKEEVFNVINPCSYTIIYPRAILIDGMELNKATLKAEQEPVLTYPLEREKR